MSTSELPILDLSDSIIVLGVIWLLSFHVSALSGTFLSEQCLATEITAVRFHSGPADSISTGHEE